MYNTIDLKRTCTQHVRLQHAPHHTKRNLLNAHPPIIPSLDMQGEDARAAMLLYRARREEWEKELRKKHVHR
jgi:hypothetical protein